MTHRRKLIEVSLAVEAINLVSARENPFGLASWTFAVGALLMLSAALVILICRI